MEQKHRRTGRTTRLADQFIQDLFNTGEVYITNHMNDVPDKKAQLMMDRTLFNIIKRRLDIEHDNGDQFIYEPKTLTIKLMPDLTI